VKDITRILSTIETDASSAAQRLFPVVYEELRRLARAQMAQERAEHTLDATALVHEAFLRLVGNADARWDGRGHFFSAAAEAMRRILIEHARRKNALKRGGAHHKVALDDELPAFATPCDDVDNLLALNDALDRLAEEDPPKAELIKLMYFGGLNLDEAAAVSGISRTTAYRRCVFARAWLYDAMTGGASRTDKNPHNVHACLKTE
jgi:RNA polymerase sigma factor (TIGR02999 family)